MKILKTKTNKEDVTFEVELDEKFWKQAFENAKKNIAKTINIPGFRKGHVPTKIIEERFTPNQIAYETLDRNQNKIVDEIIKTKEFEDTDCLDAVSKFDVGKINGDKSPTLKISFELVPTIEGISTEAIKKISIPPYKAKPISDDLVNQQIKMMTKADAMVSVKNGAIAKGDLAIIDFIGYKEGKEFAGGKANGFELEIGSKSFVDNFEDQLVGLKKGGKKEVKVTFPKDYHVKYLAGQPVKFDVTVKEVKKIEYPEITKEYLTKFKIDANNKKELQDYIKKIYNDEQEMKYQDSSIRIIQNEISRMVRLNYYPKSLIAMHARQVVSNYEQEAKKAGYPSLAAYQKSLGLNESSFKIIVTNSAKNLLEVSMAFEKLIDEYKLKVEDADRKEQLNKVIKYAGDEAKGKEMFEKNKDYMESLIMREKLFKKLVAEAKKEDPKKAIMNSAKLQALENIKKSIPSLKK